MNIFRYITTCLKAQAIILLVLVAGCQNGFTIDPTTKKIILPPNIEKTLARLDVMAESIPVIVENTQEILDTPAGKLIPEPIKTIGGTGLLALQGVGLWWLSMRKKLFQTGFNELAMANELYYVNGGDKKVMQDAESRAINPPTLKLMNKEGFKHRIINE